MESKGSFMTPLCLDSHLVFDACQKQIDWECTQSCHDLFLPLFCPQEQFKREKVKQGRRQAWEELTFTSADEKF